jgi:hypothetical protein
MNLGRLRARMLREQVVLLLLPVLAFRMLFPAGFMPRFGADHEFSMQMCHGDAQASAVMRLLDGATDRSGGENRKHEAPCVFAAVATFVAPEPAPLALAVVRHDDTPAVAFAPAPQLPLPHRTQSPRAPPLPF